MGELTEREPALLLTMTTTFMTEEAKARLEVRRLLNVLFPPRKLSERNLVVVVKAPYLLVYLTSWYPMNKSALLKRSSQGLLNIRSKSTKPIDTSLLRDPNISSPERVPRAPVTI